MNHKQEIMLQQLPIGTTGKITALHLQGEMRRRLLDLGFVPNSEIKAVRKSPAGDPVAYRVKGTTIALRAEEARQITVIPLEGE